MEHAVNFRASISTLNQAEFDLFWSTLYKKKNLIIKSLFHLFVEDSKHNKYNNVTQINTIIKQILDLRLKTSVPKLSKNNESSNNIKICFKQLSSQNIAYIASYLSLSQQTSFMRCNRDIFASTISSSSRILNLTSKRWLKNYIENHGRQYNKFQRANLSCFRFVKKVICNYGILDSGISRYKKYFPKCRLNNLLSLEFHRISTLLNSVVHKDCSDILKNIQLKHLILHKTYSKNESDLSQIIHANYNIQCISLIDVRVSQDTNKVPKYIESGLNLKGLILKNTEWNSVRITLGKIGNKLQSLHIDNLCGNIVNDIKVCDYLEEICVTNLTGYEPVPIIDISNKCNKLRRFQWKLSQDENIENVKIILNNILINNCNLEYLCIDLQLNGNIYIENVIINKLKELFNLEKCKRNNFKLRLDLSNGFDSGNSLIDLTNELKQFVLNEFMFVFTIKVAQNEKNYKKELQNKIDLMKHKYLVNIWDYNGEKKDEIKRQICICNNENKMCGYHETWMFTCKDCDK